MLIDKNVDINYRTNQHGRTALHHAIYTENAEGIDFLLKQWTTNIHLGDHYGRDCCDYARQLSSAVVKQISNFHML